MALYGIYGEHQVAACPVLNAEVGRATVAFAEADHRALMEEHGIDEIVAQYHSAFEHTFLWVIDARDAHGVQEFCRLTGLAQWNRLKIVPLMTFKDHVIPRVRETHGL